MKWQIHHRAVTVSTNLDARAGVPGDVFTADEQTAGRGRLDHVWLSPPGENLMFSAVLDVADRDPSQVATLPLVIGLAVAEAVEEMLARSLSLKWPNDVLIDGRKVAGILCERHGETVIAGVGLNVNQRTFAPEIADRATSLVLQDGCVREVRNVLASVLEQMAVRVAQWRTGGFGALLESFDARDALKGRCVSIRQTDTDETPVTGLCAGVQADGTLRVGGTDIHAGEAHVMCQ